jgi:hypothetical protein
VNELEKAVRDHMWEGICMCLSDYCCSEPACIACHWHKEDGHEKDCWLAKILDTKGEENGKTESAV